MKLAKGSLALAVTLLLAGAAQAATVTYTIYHDQNAQGAPTPGAFRVTAKVSTGDNAGLSGYGMDLLGTILTMDHQSPRDASAEKAGLEGPTGFTLGRSGDNLPFIAGFQDTSNPDVIPIYGLGQDAGGFAAQGITVGGTFEPTNQMWGAELLLAAGTYQGVAPIFNPVSPNATANVWVNNSGLAVRAPESIERVVVQIPEPATVAMSGLALIGLAAARRRFVA
jgi:hypothetical protein